MSTTDPLLLEVLKDNNETLRGNTKALTDLRLEVSGITHSVTAVVTRVVALERTTESHGEMLKDLEGVGSIVRQVKKWLIWTIAAGLSTALVLGIIVVVLGKTLLSLFSLT